MTEDSYIKLVAMTKAHRAGNSAELKVAKKVPELNGRSDFIHWRTMLLGMFVPYLGGRYWNLLNKDPATSIEGYTFIFGTFVGNTVTLAHEDDAKTERANDLIAIHGLILQTLSPAVISGLDEDTTKGTFDGVKLWDALVTKYGGKDFGTLRAAEDAIRAFQLNGRTVADAAQALQALFTEVYLASGGEQVKEDDKISALLKVFNESPYLALRATIHEAWQNGHPYTFDTIVSRFTGEESLHRLAAASTGSSAPTVNALRTQAGGSSASSSSTAITPSQHRGGRTSSRRQSGGNKGISECWWCTKPNHRMSNCRRRQNGEDPHPASHIATERSVAARGPSPRMGQQIAGAAVSSARIAALERSLAQATALLTANAYHQIPVQQPYPFPQVQPHHALVAGIAQPTSQTLVQRLGMTLPPDDVAAQSSATSHGPGFPHGH
ncbi:hypothetical protein OC844_007427 [Tilletia horrida]|nr:hypothetical protein OC844_007427 [Tilletia horrida]